jgi:NIPSNAP
MIFDHRMYTMRPNRVSAFLATYERIALPLQRRYLGEPFGFFVTDIGPLSRIVHIWQYQSIADRQARRDAMEADPAWQDYRNLVTKEDNLLDMQNMILKPVPFFTPR